MTEEQRVMAELVRKWWDEAHREALTSTSVSDVVFVLQQTATDLADWWQSKDSGFDRQGFLALAIDQPGITNAWDKP
jgi:hypothetical protein